MPLESEVRFRDIEQRLAEPSITADPAPVEIDFQASRLVAQSDVLMLADRAAFALRGPVYRAVSSNRVVNARAFPNLVGWGVQGDRP